MTEDGQGFVFSEKPIEITRGEGVYLYDTDGTEYLDVGASYACTPLGHSHPAVVDRVTDQLETLTYVQASYPTAPRTRLYEQLGATAPGDLRNVWLCNSGTEANEAALKFARSATDRPTLIATTRGFHGRTMGALSTTWTSEYREPFEPLLADVEFVEYGNVEALEDAIDDRTAGVILEPIQGEGGVNPATEAYLQAARECTTEAGAALILDEVQTGIGRTGTFWACEQADVVPDIITTAKGVANGLPMGATLVADWIAENAGSHGSTFSGGPAICAAANATIETITNEAIPAHAAEIGSYLAEELRAALGDTVREVRHSGLLMGIEVKQGATPVIRDLALNEQILALPAGRTVVRLLPPLILERSHADRIVNALTATIGTSG
ncbi:MAG: aminotransferase class III-fold pyridoxal phosphate-dependent enzyme [Halobacteriales archaeon]|nr:aminotransferase class III-fold pyridoxal phosphate-dependent enzyme [Halobacteriales archaeon]